MEWSSILAGVSIILLGFALKHFKLYFLIAGYNTMSKAEKEKVKIEKLATLMRNFLVFLGVAIIIMNLIDNYVGGSRIVDYLFYPLILASIVYVLVKANSSEYKK